MLAKYTTHHIESRDIPNQWQPRQQCREQRLPAAFGDACSRIYRIDADIELIDTHYTPHAALKIASRMTDDAPRMVITFSLVGSSRFSADTGEALVFRQGQTTITTFRGSQGLREYQGNQTVRQIRLSLGRQGLTTLVGDAHADALLNPRNLKRLTQYATSPASQLNVRALLNPPVSPALQPVWRRGHALSMLAVELDALVAPDPSDCRFNAHDLKRAEQAHAILAAEFAKPPSVAELARRVGTNQCKLKQLFRHVFNDTPYGVLLSIRMHHAHRLLMTDRCSIATAAERCGYNHASNFSTAFSRYFGFPPKRIRA